MILNLAGIRVELISDDPAAELVPGPEHRNLRCCGGVDLQLRILYSDFPILEPPAGLSVKLPAAEGISARLPEQVTRSWSMNHKHDRIEIQGRTVEHPEPCSWDMILRPSEGKGVLRVPTGWKNLDPLCYPVNYLLIHFAGLFRGSLVLHASAVEFKKGSCLFTGRSGVGKSTTASWCLAQGARLIHDDKVRVFCRDGAPGVYRMPSYPGWGAFGSDLRCIFVLERLGHFLLQPLSPAEGIGYLIQNSQYFAASEELIRCAFEAAALVAERVPIYRLSLPFDEGAILELSEKLDL